MAPQIRLIIFQLIFKGAIADRPIALTQALYRTWGSARRQDISDWTVERAQFWDRAVRVSPALRAAILRQTQCEIASSMGFSWIQVIRDFLEVLRDLEKF